MPRGGALRLGRLTGGAAARAAGPTGERAKKQVGSTNVVVSHVRFINSPFYHVVSVSCRNLRLEGLYIHAPLDSKNTDGINLMVRSVMLHSPHSPHPLHRCRSLVVAVDEALLCLLLLPSQASYSPAVCAVRPARVHPVPVVDGRDGAGALLHGLMAGLMSGPGGGGGGGGRTPRTWWCADAWWTRATTTAR